MDQELNYFHNEVANRENVAVKKLWFTWFAISLLQRNQKKKEKVND